MQKVCRRPRTSFPEQLGGGDRMERVSDWLIVSKDEALAARLVMWIRPFGACRVARDTESALQLVQEKRPRCILLDPRLSRLLVILRKTGITPKGFISVRNEVI